MNQRRTPKPGTLGISEDQFEGMRGAMTQPRYVTPGNPDSNGASTAQGALLASRGGPPTQFQGQPTEEEQGYDDDAEDEGADADGSGGDYSGGSGDAGGAERGGEVASPDAGDSGEDGGGSPVDRGVTESRGVAARVVEPGGQGPGGDRDDSEAGYVSDLGPVAPHWAEASEHYWRGYGHAIDQLTKMVGALFISGQEEAADILKSAVKSLRENR